LIRLESIIVFTLFINSYKKHFSRRLFSFSKKYFLPGRIFSIREIRAFFAPMKANFQLLFLSCFFYAIGFGLYSPNNIFMVINQEYNNVFLEQFFSKKTSFREPFFSNNLRKIITNHDQML
jgi:hypothetical protein